MKAALAGDEPERPVCPDCGGTGEVWQEYPVSPETGSFYGVRYVGRCDCPAGLTSDERQRLEPLRAAVQGGGSRCEWSAHVSRKGL